MRATNYLLKPTDEWIRSYDNLNTTTLFLVARHGPAVFGIKDETDKLFKVTLGNPHKCSCNSKSSSCIHLLFSLIKVLKIHREHPLCYQSSLTDAEMTHVLNGLAASNMRPSGRKKKSSLKQSSADESEDLTGKVPRQALNDQDDETCPICQDDMNGNQALSWCRTGCGNNVHAKCMLKYSQYKISNHQEATCPLCREPWDQTLLKLDCKGKSSLKNSCSPIYCSKCKYLIRDDFYRCIECSQMSCKSGSTNSPVDFCKSCMGALDSLHDTHHFLTAEAAVNLGDLGLNWKVFDNPKRPMASSSNTQLMQALQERELTDEDYDLLLNLDRKNLPDLYSVLVDALPPVSRHQMKSGIRNKLRCWCALTNDSTSVFAGGQDSIPFRVLPCGHCAHDRCLQADLKTIIASNEDFTVKIADYSCAHQECGMRVFCGLARKRRKKKSGDNLAETGKNKKTEATDLGTTSRVDSEVTNHSAPINPVASSGGLLQITGISSNNNCSTIVTQQTRGTMGGRRIHPRRPHASQDPVNSDVMSIQLSGENIYQTDNKYPPRRPMLAARSRSDREMNPSGIMISNMDGNTTANNNWGEENNEINTEHCNGLAQNSIDIAAVENSVYGGGSRMADNGLCRQRQQRLPGNKPPKLPRRTSRLKALVSGSSQVAESELMSVNATASAGSTRSAARETNIGIDQSAATRNLFDSIDAHYSSLSNATSWNDNNIGESNNHGSRVKNKVSQILGGRLQRSDTNELVLSGVGSSSSSLLRGIDGGVADQQRTTGPIAGMARGALAASASDIAGHDSSSEPSTGRSSSRQQSADVSAANTARQPSRNKRIVSRSSARDTSVQSRESRSSGNASDSELSLGTSQAALVGGYTSSLSSIRVSRSGGNNGNTHSSGIALSGNVHDTGRRNSMSPLPQLGSYEDANQNGIAGGFITHDNQHGSLGNSSSGLALAGLLSVNNGRANNNGAQRGLAVGAGTIGRVHKGRSNKLSSVMSAGDFKSNNIGSRLSGVGTDMNPDYHGESVSGGTMQGGEHSNSTGNIRVSPSKSIRLLHTEGHSIGVNPGSISPNRRGARVRAMIPTVPTIMLDDSSLSSPPRNLEY